MARPLIIAHHLIWTLYGSWLPNDPRGSGSKAIGCDVITQLGELHLGRKQVQPAGRDIRQFYASAQGVLKHPVVMLGEAARQTAGEAMMEVIIDEKHTCYACAVMPDHVHILIRKHKHHVEQMIEKLKDRSRLRLSNSPQFHNDHPIWTSGGGWKVFMDHPDDVERTIAYINRNPKQMNIASQEWSFVKTYDRWPLHVGHSPDSPYVKRLKAVGRYCC